MANQGPVKASDAGKKATQVNKTTNDSANNQAAANTTQGTKTILDKIDEKHKKFLEGRKWSQYKALDFSNVSLYPQTKDDKLIAIDTKTDPRALRRFHQMIIYNETDNIMIASNLPERIQYTIGSKWEQPLAGFGSGLTNLILQASSVFLKNAGMDAPESGINRATSLKIWGGSEPISLNLTIPVLDDNANGSGANLVEALEKLSEFVLPKRAGNSFYTPPPNPANLHIKFKNSYLSGKGDNNFTEVNVNKHYGRILVQLGGILLLDHCIIESVSVTYTDTKTMIYHNYSKEKNRYNSNSTNSGYLHPMLAEVTIKITTSEGATVESYQAALWGNENKDAQYTYTIGDSAQDRIKEQNSQQESGNTTPNPDDKNTQQAVTTEMQNISNNGTPVS